MNKSAVEVMIDIETFDTTDTAVTFQVGLVMFNSQHEVICSKTWNLNVDEQIDAGRTISASTLAFHLGIPANALSSLSGHSVTMDQFATDITEVFRMYEPSSVWSKGSFDFNVLENMLTLSINSQAPWTFRQKRELRTLMSECNVPKGEVSHTAIEDCFAQIEQLKQCRIVTFQPMKGS